MEKGIVARTPHLFAAYHEIHAGPLHGVPILRRINSLIKLARGTLQTLRLIGKYKPSVVFLTGGFVTFPVAVAAWLRRIPLAIYLPDIEPGQAIKATAALAKVVYVTVPDSAKFFKPGKTVVTGYPLRADLLTARRDEGIAHFGLDPARLTLLVVGGSRGSKNINQAIIQNVSALLAEGLQIIHVSGELDAPAVKAAHDALPAEQQAHYHVFSYLHGDMGLALAAADLVVGRAGASALGEFPHFGLPTILVPYPYAWRYQKVNADWLAERGAGIRVNDEDMKTELLPTIQELIRDREKLVQMREAAQKLGSADSAKMIAAKLRELAG
jgi:UDP-N-acetylglucosamine--N-acetylmuramyl-(pentapeptide) pyrophosphoryl-undecaprenol N-acetylglucosamine transferase